MKKKLLPILSLVLILSFISLISFVSAVDITLSKDSYYPGETLQAEISGDFATNLNLDYIGIYSNKSIHKLPAQSGIEKNNYDYFFYAVLPETPGDYSLKIENIKYTEGTSQTSNPLIKSFSIITTNESYLSLNPGVIAAPVIFLLK